MGLKTEIGLFLAITLIVTGSFMLKLNDSVETSQMQSKELEFKQTTFTEVDTVKLKGQSYGESGSQENGILRIHHVDYHSEEIKSLIAKQGIYHQNIMSLEGDVVMHDFKGYRYETQHARYDQRHEILTIVSPFVAMGGKNMIKGKHLIYDTYKQELNATHIEAIFYTIEK